MASILVIAVQTGSAVTPAVSSLRVVPAASPCRPLSVQTRAILRRSGVSTADLRVQTCPGQAGTPAGKDGTACPSVPCGGVAELVDPACWLRGCDAVADGVSGAGPLFAVLAVAGSVAGCAGGGERGGVEVDDGDSEGDRDAGGDEIASDERPHAAGRPRSPALAPERERTRGAGQAPRGTAAAHRERGEGGRASPDAAASERERGRACGSGAAVAVGAAAVLAEVITAVAAAGELSEAGGEKGDKTKSAA